MSYRPKKEFTMKQKIAGSALCLLLYRMLSFVPLPYMNTMYIKTAIGMNGSLGLLDVMSGGNLGNMSLMALGIGPWITASIVLQLVGMIFPSLSDLNKDADGRQKYKFITFLTAVAFAVFESVGLLVGFGRQGLLQTGAWYGVVVPALLMIFGTGILSLMSWYIDDKLFGNGTSLILTTGILCSYVSDGTALLEVATQGRGITASFIICAVIAVALFLLFLYTVFISSCEKRIKVFYSQKMSGSAKASNVIPLKLISGGVVPVIFASTIITFPAFIGSAFRSDAAWLKIFNTNCWLDVNYPWASIGLIAYMALIIVFGYFCQLMYVNPIELANNLQKQGGTVPGIRPGKPTSDHIVNQARWLTALGGICLCVIVVIPVAVSSIFGISGLSFLGTSILITVSTIDETWKTWKTYKLSQDRITKGSVMRGIL